MIKRIVQKCVKKYKNLYSVELKYTRTQFNLYRFYLCYLKNNIDLQSQIYKLQNSLPSPITLQSILTAARKFFNISKQNLAKLIKTLSALRAEHNETLADLYTQLNNKKKQRIIR